MTRSRRALACSALALALVGGCSVVGEPVVDHLTGSSGGPTVVCSTPPSCESVALQQRVQVRLREALVRSSCLGNDLPCAIGDAAPAPWTGDPQAGEGAAACAPTWTTDDLVELAARSESIELGCERARIVAAGEDAALFVRLERAVLEGSELTIESSTPLTIVLAASQLRAARVHLQGPITLRLEADTTLESVQFSADARARLRPRLEIEQLAADDVLVGTPDAPFLGSVSTARSTLGRSQVVADLLQVESTVIASGVIDVLALSAADLQLQDSLLAATTGTLASAVLRRSEITACDALSVLGSEIKDARFAPCDTLLRMYDSELTDSIADGPIELDYTIATMTAFGAQAPTDLVVWGGSLGSVNLCELARSARFGSGPGVTCNDCADAALAGELAACNVPPLLAQTSGNSCDALQELPTCAQPWPERARPLDL